MKIAQVWFRQHSLKRAWQIAKFATHVLDGGFFGQPIQLQECDDGEIEILDGHHRVVALWLAGLDEFRREDFVLYGQRRPSQRFWKVEEFEKYRQWLPEEVTATAALNARKGVGRVARRPCEPEDWFVSPVRAA